MLKKDDRVLVFRGYPGLLLGQIISVHPDTVWAYKVRLDNQVILWCKKENVLEPNIWPVS